MFSLYNMREDARVDLSVVVNCRAMHEYGDAIGSNSDDNDEAHEDAQFGSFLHYSTTTLVVAMPRTYKPRNVRTIAGRDQQRETVARVAFSEHESDWKTPRTTTTRPRPRCTGRRRRWRALLQSRE